MAGTLNACIAGFTILCFVLGLLISQPEIPLHVNVMFPKLSGESAYSLMALMGANIIAHNFYVHSSVVQVCSGVSCSLAYLVNIFPYIWVYIWRRTSLAVSNCPLLEVMWLYVATCADIWGSCLAWFV